MATGSLFGIGASGLEAFKKALDVSSQNIVNHTTPGYSRQTPVIQTNYYQSSGGQVLGTGVQVGAVNRMFDRFMAEKARNYASDHAQFSAYREVTEDLDNFLSNTHTNVATAIQQFFHALQELQAHSGDTASRNIFLQNSELWVQRLGNMSQKLQDERIRLNQRIEQQVGEINAITQEIGKLNQNILFARSGSQHESPNALLDQREYLLGQLAEMVSVRAVERSDGSYDIALPNGFALVLGAQATPLSAQPSAADPAVVVVGHTAGAYFEAFEQTQLGGSLGGLIAAREDVVLPALSQLGMMGAALVQSANAQHQKGVDLNGNLGGLLFSDLNTLSAQLSRSISHERNAGTAAFAVSIAPIEIQSETSHRVSGDASALVSVSTGLTALSSGELVINQIAIGASVSDGVSSVNPDASAIAMAAAINAYQGQTGVSAVAEPNVVSLGSFTAGASALSGTNLVINGVSIVPAGNTVSDLVVAIEATAATTGVTAMVDSTGALVLEAFDGRNIQISTNGSAPAGANFSGFSLTTAHDEVKRSSLHLVGDAPITIAGSFPQRAGLVAGVTPDDPGYLTGSDYHLVFDGTQYHLTRLSDHTEVATQTSPAFSVDGLVIQLNHGTALAGDEFLIMPTRNLAPLIDVAIQDPSLLAMAAPVAVEPDGARNTGTGVMVLDAVCNTSGSPASTAYVYGNAFDPATPRALSPPLEVRFLEVNGRSVYRIFDVSQGSAQGVQIGPDYAYTPGQKQDLFPAPGVIDPDPAGTRATYTYDPGYRVSFTGTPKPGDVFTIGYNATAAGDPRNAGLLSDLQDAPLLGISGTTLQATYVGLIAQVGTYTQSAQVGEGSTQVLMSQAQDRLAAISGVNLDEECANLILYQEAYQAAAQVISTANRIFDVLLEAFR